MLDRRFPMHRTETEKLRKPQEILAAMDKDGVRSDANLLAQLNAELNVSLAVQSEVVSRRNLKVASIACVTAISALGISLMQVLRSSGVDQAYGGDASEYEKQVEKFDEQTRITDDQLARADLQLTKAERQGERMDELILKWEKQAKSQDDILASVDLLLKAAPAKTIEQTEQGGAVDGRPAGD